MKRTWCRVSADLATLISVLPKSGIRFGRRAVPSTADNRSAMLLDRDIVSSKQKAGYS
jgi:hypothetical protein